MRCKEFLPTANSKLHHDFLRHYEVSRSAPLVEEKPIIITNVGPIKIYEINFQSHSSKYDFFNSVRLVDEFLFNVKNRIERSDINFLFSVAFPCRIFSHLLRVSTNL